VNPVFSVINFTLHTSLRKTTKNLQYISDPADNIYRIVPIGGDNPSIEYVWRYRLCASHRGIVRMPGKIKTGLGSLLILVTLAAGCGQRVPEGEVVYVQDDGYYRNLYNQRRPVPPETYSVPPKPPKDNGFGEFDDNLYENLDQQPELPRLPEDNYLPPTGGQYLPPAGGQSAPVHAPVSIASHSTADELFNDPKRRVTPSPSHIYGPEIADINTGNTFYPVEQLIYGGDFPDLDQPDQYRLMPRDEITIMVKDHPEFSGPLTIQADGTVRPENTPDLIRVRGLTTEEAAEAIRRVLAVYVKGDCIVRVQANRAGGGYYFVFGDVLQPGRFPMGLEPVKLSDAVLAANWEANPGRHDMLGDDLGPAFPAANPRGKFIAPPSADLASVMLVSPHRSQPVRTFHDVRAAMQGMTGDDPLIRPGQIIIVPSLAQQKNAGLPEVPEGLMSGQGFASSGTPAKLPEVEPTPRPKMRIKGPRPPEADLNMEMTNNVTSQGETSAIRRYNPETDYPDYREKYDAKGTARRSNRVEGW